MLMLLFYIGSDCYAMDASRIVEIIPRITLSPIPHVPTFVAGLINYGGKPVPVVDLSQFVNDRPSSSALHTRIILIKTANQQLVGLIAEKVTETQEIESAQFMDPGVKVRDLPFFNGVYNQDGKNILLFKLDPFVEALKDVIEV